MQRNKTIIDIVFEDMTVKVFYSDGEVKALFCDEVTEYVYKKAKEEIGNLNLQEKKQIAHNKMALTTLFFAGISFLVMESTFIGDKISSSVELLNSLLTLAAVTYASVSTFDVLNTALKKKNIVKTIKIIDEALSEKNEYDFQPTFLEKLKLSDRYDKFSKRFLKGLISSNIVLNDIEKLMDKTSLPTNYDNVIILESTEVAEKQKVLVKTLKR